MNPENGAQHCCVGSFGRCWRSVRHEFGRGAEALTDFSAKPRLGICLQAGGRYEVGIGFQKRQESGCEAA